jgi:hypothetical protein
MGKINRGILGGFTGKVGNVVGSSWKGIETMRALPISVLNPRTTAQISNRARFGDISTLSASILTTIVKPLNDRFASKMSGYNMFTSRCKSAFDSNGNFQPGQLLLSTGKLGETAFTANISSGDDDVTMTFSAVPVGSYQMGADRAYACVFDINGILLGVSSNVTSRASGSVNVVLSRQVVEGEYVECYLSFLRADGTIVGTSYALEVEVQA